MKARNLIAEIEATEKLIARGWVQKICEKCKGSGIAQDENYKFHSIWPCSFCDGEGHNWIAPIVK